ncbi:hypothetical protein BDF20DRAFT_917750 [Mycotypha africana]|uniref:uncharacterized protein n=1 Tax=Mycotypha africana TaxID=64632 RepID=UPI0023008B72|nr:uncharacterized protein BDF20DRAFT_917750 [Mycotypha africana]KAI8967282.1 hypothetical protein BDF20DRAFT_917750 [Mycotypha africana]
MTDSEINNQTTNYSKRFQSGDCQLYEMVQYQCEHSQSQIVCSPLTRLFLKCAGVPTVEVTPEYDQNGDPIMPK